MGGSILGYMFLGFVFFLVHNFFYSTKKKNRACGENNSADQADPPAIPPPGVAIEIALLFFFFFEVFTNHVGLSNPLLEYVHPHGRADISHDIILYGGELYCTMLTWLPYGQKRSKCPLVKTISSIGALNLWCAEYLTHEMPSSYYTCMTFFSILILRERFSDSGQFRIEVGCPVGGTDSVPSSLPVMFWCAIPPMCRRQFGQLTPPFCTFHMLTPGGT